MERSRKSSLLCREASRVNDICDCVPFVRIHSSGPSILKKLKTRSLAVHDPAAPPKTPTATPDSSTHVFLRRRTLAYDPPQAAVQTRKKPPGVFKNLDADYKELLEMNARLDAQKENIAVNCVASEPAASLFGMNDYFGKLLETISLKRRVGVENATASHAERSFSLHLPDRSLDFHSVPNTVDRRANNKLLVRQKLNHNPLYDRSSLIHEPAIAPTVKLSPSDQKYAQVCDDLDMELLNDSASFYESEIYVPPLLSISSPANTAHPLATASKVSTTSSRSRLESILPRIPTTKRKHDTVN